MGRPLPTFNDNADPRVGYATNTSSEETHDRPSSSTARNSAAVPGDDSNGSLADTPFIASPVNSQTADPVHRGVYMRIRRMDGTSYRQPVVITDGTQNEPPSNSTSTPEIQPVETQPVDNLHDQRQRRLADLEAMRTRSQIALERSQAALAAHASLFARDSPYALTSNDSHIGNNIDPPRAGHAGDASNDTSREIMNNAYSRISNRASTPPGPSSTNADTPVDPRTRLIEAIVRGTQILAAASSMNQGAEDQPLLRMPSLSVQVSLQITGPDGVVESRNMPTSDVSTEGRREALSILLEQYRQSLLDSLTRRLQPNESDGLSTAEASSTIPATAAPVLPRGAGIATRAVLNNAGLRNRLQAIDLDSSPSSSSSDSDSDTQLAHDAERTRPDQTEGHTGLQPRTQFSRPPRPRNDLEGILPADRSSGLHSAGATRTVAESRADSDRDRILSEDEMMRVARLSAIHALAPSLRPFFMTHQYRQSNSVDNTGREDDGLTTRGRRILARADARAAAARHSLPARAAEDTMRPRHSQNLFTIPTNHGLGVTDSDISGSASSIPVQRGTQLDQTNVSRHSRETSQNQPNTMPRNRHRIVVRQRTRAEDPSRPVDSATTTRRSESSVSDNTITSHGNSQPRDVSARLHAMGTRLSNLQDQLNRMRNDGDSLLANPLSVPATSPSSQNIGWVAPPSARASTAFSTMRHTLESVLLQPPNGSAPPTGSVPRAGGLEDLRDYWVRQWLNGEERVDDLLNRRERAIAGLYTSSLPGFNASQQQTHVELPQVTPATQWEGDAGANNSANPLLTQSQFTAHQPHRSTEPIPIPRDTANASTSTETEESTRNPPNPAYSAEPFRPNPLPTKLSDMMVNTRFPRIVR